MTQQDLAARVHALIAQWRELADNLAPYATALNAPSAVTWLKRCANELEAALAAALAPQNENDARTPEWKETAGNLSIGRHDAKSAAVCLDCQRPYEAFPMDMLLPRWQWLTIHPDDDGLLCASCIVNRAARIPGAVAIHAVIGIAPPAAALAPNREIGKADE